MKLQKGFTLIEIMVAVIIVAILASVAIPAYNDYVIRGKLVEATATLSDARIKMEQYFQDNLTYENADVTPGPWCPTPTANFTYACSALSKTTYTITATGTGAVSSFAYTIDQANTKMTTNLKDGWGVHPSACWITRKGDAC